VAHARRFRFGLLGESVRTASELVDTARAAEQEGFSTCLLRDPFIEEPFGHQLAPLTALAPVAALTRTLRLGTLVLCNDYRHPVLAAKEVATLDQLSGGRFELGIGAGFSRPEYEQAGLPFDPPGRRVERLGEALQVFKGLFSAQPFTFSGQHYRVNGLEAFPNPSQSPRPPILVAGGGRRMLSLAAREADSVGILTASLGTGRLTPDPSGLLAESIAQKIDWIRDAAGPRFAELELSIITTIVVDENRLQSAERLARERGWEGLAADRVLEMPSVFIGSVAQITEQMHERRERYGISYYVIRDGSLASASPVVVRLTGS
jgi:probable F420-dependent oxidoreductase